MTRPYRFAVDARAVVTLGRESIKDHSTAILELVKNAYDAGAGEVLLEFRVASAKPDEWQIRIVDDGIGMNEDDVFSSWLRIGFSAKRAHKRVGQRRKTGEKGIGRLSADRLGANLELRSQTRQDPPVSLYVDWNQFEADGKELSQIVLERRTSAPELRGHARSGTELLIGALRQRWKSKDIALLRRELAILTAPDGRQSDFRISLETDLDGATSGTISSSLEDVAEVEVDVQLSSKGKVAYQAWERDPAGKRRRADGGAMDWEQFVVKEDKGERPQSKPRIGEVRIRLSFYPKSKEVLRGTQLSLRDIGEFLELHAGVRIYRDGIRVRPYGDPRSPEGDWLSLNARKASNPAGKGRQSFRVTNKQVVGIVWIGRDSNQALVDSSSREGLVHDDAFADLQEFALGAVRVLETQYHQTAAAREQVEAEKTSPSIALADIEESLREARVAIRGIVSQGRTEERALERTKAALEAAAKQAKTAGESVDEIEAQSRLYRGLCTIGIAAAVFGHETQSSIDLFVAAATVARKILLKSPDESASAIQEIDKSLSHAQRVGAWGRFALARIRRDKRTRRTLDISKVCRSLIAEMQPIFASSGIAIDQKIKEVSGRGFAMDVEAVLLNLLTNAFTASQQNGRKRRVRVQVSGRQEEGRSGVEIIVSDSGPGVAVKFRERVWEPMFSTKVMDGKRPDGTGLGLSVIQSIVDETRGKRSVGRDEELLGAAFKNLDSAVIRKG